jgi:hypothetical protein
MDSMMENKKPSKFIIELMQGKSEKEMLEAEYNLREFLQVTWELYCRVENIGPEGNLDFMREFRDFEVDKDKSSSPFGSFEFEIKKKR